MHGAVQAFHYHLLITACRMLQTPQSKNRVVKYQLNAFFIMPWKATAVKDGAFQKLSQWTDQKHFLA